MTSSSVKITSFDSADFSSCKVVGQLNPVPSDRGFAQVCRSAASIRRTPSLAGGPQ